MPLTFTTGAKHTGKPIPTSGAKFLKKSTELMPVHGPKVALHQHLGGKEPGRSLKNVHASELTKPDGICPRLYALADVTHAKTGDEWISTSEAVTYQIGRDQQDAIVHWFAEMGRAIGHWKCLGCKKLHVFCMRPDKCSNCHCRGFKPEEVRFLSTKNGASCGVDLLVSGFGPKLKPMEIKTMKDDEWKKLVAPLAEHRERSTLYLRIIEEDAHYWSEMIDTSEIIILYVTKGGFGVKDDELKKWGITESFSPFKEYRVPRGNASVSHLTSRAKIVKDFRDEKIGMPEGICSTAMDKRAQYCLCKKPCWSGEHPPEFFWLNKASA